MMENCVNHVKNIGLPYKERIIMDINKKDKLKEEKYKHDNVIYYKCLCGEFVKTHLKYKHQENSERHDEYREKMWKDGFSPDGTPREP